MDSPRRSRPGGHDLQELDAQHETELSWIRQIRQELEQMEAARQWVKS